MMDYKLHYQKLCERGKSRKIHGYYETHHIIPRCMGGSDETCNLVKLTPEEHYLAHQLLVKIYPKERGLVWAAIQMTSQPNGNRSNNKLYGWLKRRQQKVAKKRIGQKNGSHGRKWYFNPVTLENVKCFPHEIPDGFVKGRKFKPNTNCKQCGNDTGNTYSVYCSEHNPQTNSKSKMGKCKKCGKKYNKKESETGIHSPYCSLLCKQQMQEENEAVLLKETQRWYDEYKNKNYKSLREFSRKNNLNVMTVSKRFRKYIK